MTYGFWADFSMLLLGVISALLILVVLLQRGRGGGLAGAFGGLGGQSAFGTKAGDVFTKITIGLVTAWVLLAGVSGVLARKGSEKAQGLPTEDEVENRDQEDNESSSSMSAVGNLSSEDADDATDDTAAPSSEGENGNDDDASPAEEPADSETEKTEAEAAPSIDEKSDTEPESSDSEAATPDTTE